MRERTPAGAPGRAGALAVVVPQVLGHRRQKDGRRSQGSGEQLRVPAAFRRGPRQAIRDDHESEQAPVGPRARDAGKRHRREPRAIPPQQRAASKAQEGRQRLGVRHGAEHARGGGAEGPRRLPGEVRAEMPRRVVGEQRRTDKARVRQHRAGDHVPLGFREKWQQLRRGAHQEREEREERGVAFVHVAKTGHSQQMRGVPARERPREPERQHRPVVRGPAFDIRGGVVWEDEIAEDAPRDRREASGEDPCDDDAGWRGWRRHWFDNTLVLEGAARPVLSCSRVNGGSDTAAVAVRQGSGTAAIPSGDRVN